MVIELSKEVFLTEIQIKDGQDLFELMSKIYPAAYQYLWNDDCSWYLNKLYSQDQIAKDIEEENGVFYFVEVAGVKEGILKIQINTPYPDIPELPATRLHRVYLSESTQGKGISKLVMSYVEDISRSIGSKILWLDCMDSKHQALNYYTKHGFLKGSLSTLDYDLLIDKYRGIYLMYKTLK